MRKAEAAGYLGLSVRNLERRKDIPHYKLGRKKLFRKTELDEYMCTSIGSQVQNNKTWLG